MRKNDIKDKALKLWSKKWQPWATSFLAEERKKNLFILIGASVLGIVVWKVFFCSHEKGKPSLGFYPAQRKIQSVESSQILDSLGAAFFQNQFPPQVVFDQKKLQVAYTFEDSLQLEVEKLFHLYRPDYGAFVALDATSGRVLAMVSHHQGKASIVKNLTLQSSFPSASVFKVVTAAAALETQKVTAESLLGFQGRRSTLYRSQVFQPAPSRWMRWLTFKQAFAQSVNPVFARLGIYEVGPTVLSQYASLFGFNRDFEAELPIQEGKAWIPEDDWGLGESASGFTQQNTMSPMQGALIAASVVHHGMIMKPYVVSELVEENARMPFYQATPQLAWKAISPQTAHHLRQLMQETVQKGTSRSAFRGFSKSASQLSLNDIEVGGKTGSLSGNEPKGKYDWFVGYADDGSRKLALAVMTVHQQQWRVKSSYLARRAMEKYYGFSQDLVQKRKKVLKVSKRGGKKVS